MNRVSRFLTRNFIGVYLSFVLLVCAALIVVGVIHG